MDTQLHSVPAVEVQEGALAQDQASFESFFEDTHARLFGALTVVTGSRHEAEEVMQDTYLRLWERWDRLEMEDPTAYLFRTAMNVFRNRIRRAGLAVRRATALAPRSDDLENVEDRDVVVRALAVLTPDQRAAVVLTNYLGLSSEEAGRILGIRASTVRALSTKARASMRDHVEVPR
jgi:RNA polymerase sigma factor (sigma-70 family)